MTHFAQYLPGLAFLTLVNVIVALPCVLFIKNKPLAVLLSVIVSTVLLKTWAYVSIGGFDLTFLSYLLGVGFITAIGVMALVAFIRRHFLPA